MWIKPANILQPAFTLNLIIEIDKSPNYAYTTVLLYITHILSSYINSQTSDQCLMSDQK